VKFNFDAIDETDILEETLKPRVESLGGTLEKVTLSGNHITMHSGQTSLHPPFVCTILLFTTVKFSSLLESAFLNHHVLIHM